MQKTSSTSVIVNKLAKHQCSCIGTNFFGYIFCVVVCTLLFTVDVRTHPQGIKNTVIMHYSGRNDSVKARAPFEFARSWVKCNGQVSSIPRPIAVKAYNRIILRMRSYNLLGRSRNLLGRSRNLLGRSHNLLGRSHNVLGRSRNLLGIY